jgi:hypothetical protein
LVGVDVRALEWYAASLDDVDGLHAPTSLGAAKRPLMAVAAATTGDTK